MGHHAPRPKTAGERVRAHLAAYPEDYTLSVRQLADKLHVGKSTVSRVKQENQP
jgi:DNA-binding MurR/RpiR family transcriptional regulator